MRAFKYLLIILILFSLISCSRSETKRPTSIPPEAIECKIVKVFDGDTFSCISVSQQEIKVRMLGIDTPESSANRKAHRDAERQGVSVDEIIRLGKISAEFTKNTLKPGMRVFLEQDVQPVDKYGRMLAYVWLENGRMLNEIIIEEGYAQVLTIPPNVKYQDILLEAQRRARESKKGLWGL
ncbi:MAG: thermonuclease family protein [Aquificaceae bacterium]